MAAPIGRHPPPINRRVLLTINRTEIRTELSGATGGTEVGAGQARRRKGSYGQQDEA